MAVKTIHVSDISGKEADEQSLGRLVVHEHPEYSDLPVALEALPEEIEPLRDSSARFVTVEWVRPGARKGERLTVPLEDFNLLAGPGVMDNAIQDALISKHRSRARTSDGARATSPRSGRAKVNYATLEHAGEPHRGRITEAEKELVRGNLDEINKRLSATGMREIDPNDPAMKERYGL
ncbi:MAG TPA: hypothetical protein VE776_14865 [Actinomycetota bacterium]|nr:hypothetical protein [Actinomycetota bacterium]